jgi:integrase
MKLLLADSGLPPITLHGLRHSFASIAHANNMPLMGISRALGHSSPVTTTKIYTHLFDETHLAVVQAVGAAIGAGK